MRIVRSHGFTIIELMLFLGVSGVLVAGLMIGSGAAISQQRYQDSVISLKTFLQNQYIQSVNVINTRSGDQMCTGGTVIEDSGTPITPQSRGTSDCLIMGRLVTIGEDGKTLTARTVIGYRTATGASVEDTDIAELQNNYSLTTSATIEPEDTTVEWDGTVVQGASMNPAPTSILIIRSPLNGTPLTFTRVGAAVSVSDLVSISNRQATAVLCVAPSGNSAIMGSRQAVRINGGAASQSAIEVPSERDRVCG